MTSADARRPRATRARSVVLAVLAVLGPSAAHADKPPPPKAGIVPLELGDVAKASGPELRVDDPDVALAGKRVRFLADAAQPGRTPSGESFLVLTGDGTRLVFRLPAPLEGPERLAGGGEWEVIARLDRSVTLSDGQAAIAVMPDLLVKTPGLPSEEKPTDVVARVSGESFLVDPGLEPQESSEPLYRLRVTQPGKGLKREFTDPGASGVAVAKDDQGRTMYNVIRTDKAADGRERTTSCIFRVDGGKLRNVAYGEVVVDPAGQRSDEVYVNFEEEQFNDTWSARKRSFEPNTYAATCLGAAMAGFPDAARVVRLYLWGGSGIPIPVYAYVDGEETLDVRGRSESARRIRVGLDVRQASRSIDVPEVWRQHAESAGEVWFSGESTYWIAAAPPHDLLRFEGALGPPGAPEAVIERIR